MRLLDEAGIIACSRHIQGVKKTLYDISHGYTSEYGDAGKNIKKNIHSLNQKLEPKQHFIFNVVTHFENRVQFPLCNSKQTSTRK